MYLLVYSINCSDFRLDELEALMTLYERHYRIKYCELHSPFVLVESDGDCKPFERSILIKYIYDFLYEATCIENLISQLNINDYKEHKLDTFRFETHCHGGASNRVEMITQVIANMGIKGKISMKDPQQQYGLCIYLDNKKVLTKIYMGRLLSADTNHKATHLFNLKDRKYIGTTSMDSSLSLLMANCALVKPGSLVYDPFVGTGSLLVVSSFFGACSIGSDFDGRQIRGTMKGAQPNTNGIAGNMEFYNLAQNYVGSCVFDFATSPFRQVEILDAIVADPPYCIRASAKKIKSGDREKELSEYYKFPETEMYSMSEIVYDLLDFSARNLKIKGRLVYWLPIVHGRNRSETLSRKNIPEHPSFKIISYPKQTFPKWTRFMVIMEKTLPYIKMEDKISFSDFREGYYSKS